MSVLLRLQNEFKMSSMSFDGGSQHQMEMNITNVGSVVLQQEGGTDVLAPSCFLFQKALRRLLPHAAQRLFLLVVVVMVFLLRCGFCDVA